MLMVNQLIGFGAGTSGGVVTLISAGSGSVVHLNMGFNTANSFDSDTTQDSGSDGDDCTQTTARGASTAGYNNAVGKDWGSGVTKTVTQVKAYGPSDASFLTSGASTTIKVQGSSDGSSWTDLTGEHSTTGGSGVTVTISGAEIDTTTAYRYHRVNISGNGVNSAGIAEVEFYETI